VKALPLTRTPLSFFLGACPTCSCGSSTVKTLAGCREALEISPGVRGFWAASGPLIWSSVGIWWAPLFVVRYRHKHSLWSDFRSILFSLARSATATFPSPILNWEAVLLVPPFLFFILLWRRHLQISQGIQGSSEACPLLHERVSICLNYTPSLGQRRVAVSVVRRSSLSRADSPLDSF